VEELLGDDGAGRWPNSPCTRFALAMPTLPAVSRSPPVAEMMTL